MNKFLGKEGLTATSANHIANVAKEMYEALEAKLDGIRLCSRDYTLAVNGNTYRVENESGKDEFAKIQESLAEIASLKSLIAWLREGIKSKENECSIEAEEKWIQEQIKLGRIVLMEPKIGPSVTFADVLAAEPVERQARYYALEARCATFGKYIHPGGHLSVARKEYMNRLKNPNVIVNAGQNAEINSFSSQYSVEEVDSQFFALQQEYRSVQAEFNSMKSQLESHQDDLNRIRYDEYKKAWKEWNVIHDKAVMEYRAKIKAMKIVFPDNLRAIYERVQAVASER